MTLKSMELKNFTVFENLEIKFCNGVNIFIGENGTGKTHILKLLYGVMDSFSNKFLNQRKGSNLSDYFLSSEKDNKFLARDVSKNSFVNLISEELDIKFQIYYKDENNNVLSNNMQVINDGNKNKKHPIFIPAKEMLSHSKGLLALEREREIPFDKTLIDIVAKSHLGEKKEKSPIEEELLNMLSKVIDGKVVFKNDTFYVQKKSGLTIEFSMEAEGLRKFALLWKLISNGAVEKGATLFWDEPEANINSQLKPILVDILLELQRNNIQILIATHDYNLAKYFEIRRQKNDDVQFHCLYKENSEVKISSSDYFGKVENNPIIEADEKLLDEVLDKNLGD